MKRLSTLIILPLIATIAGCGESERAGAGNIVTTNTGNIVLNDAQGNYAFRGDNEQAAGEQAAGEQAAGEQASGEQAAGGQDTSLSRNTQ